MIHFVMLEDKEILQQFGEALVAGIKESIPIVSGKTAESVRMEVTDNDAILTIYGSAYLSTLVYGRKPTKKRGRGNGEMLENIKEWIRLKGLDISPFAVVANIHKWGNTLNRIATGVGDVNYQANPIPLQQVLNQQRIDSFRGTFAREYLNKVKSEVLKDIQ